MRWDLTKCIRALLNQPVGLVRVSSGAGGADSLRYHARKSVQRVL